MKKTIAVIVWIAVALDVSAQLQEAQPEKMPNKNIGLAWASITEGPGAVSPS